MKLSLVGKTCQLRPWALADAPDLARHADDEGIARNLRDAFPSPYTAADAQGYLASIVDVPEPHMLCIEVDGHAAGGIGIKRLTDVERVGAEIGYWLGRPFWGKGVVSEAVQLATPFFMESFELSRIFALPFARNAASIRVLEKAGYRQEGILHRSAIKAGVLQDQIMFAYVPEGPAPAQ